MRVNFSCSSFLQSCCRYSFYLVHSEFRHCASSEQTFFSRSSLSLFLPRTELISQIPPFPFLSAKFGALQFEEGKRLAIFCRLSKDQFLGKYLFLGVGLEGLFAEERKTGIAILIPLPFFVFFLFSRSNFGCIGADCTWIQSSKLIPALLFRHTFPQKSTKKYPC